MFLRALQLWLLGQAVLWLAVAALYATDVPAVWTEGFGWAVTLLAGLSYASLWAVLRAGRRPADWVTAARFVLLLTCFAAAWARGGPSLALWAGAGVALLADLLDGWAARRWGGSPAGAILDMETDQLGIFLLALLAVYSRGCAPWILLIPVLRPAYVLLGALRGLPTFDPKPQDGDNRRGRLVAAFVMLAVFVAAGPTWSPGWLRQALAGLALAALIWSFWSDFSFLLRRRRPEAEI